MIECNLLLFFQIQKPLLVNRCKHVHSQFLSIILLMGQIMKWPY